MQFAITDPAALAFARGFYQALAHDEPIDEAVRLGRIAIDGTGERTLEWVTPVLYLRTRETRLFAINAQPRSASAAQAPVGEQAAHEAALHGLYVQALAALRTGRVEEAIVLLDSLLTLDPGYRDATERRDAARRSQQLAARYKRARAAEDAQKWAEAAREYGLILEIDSRYRDAGERRDACRLREQITSLQDELRLHAEARNWEAVVTVSDELAALDPQASDVDGLATIAREQLECQRREAEEQAPREAEEQARFDPPSLSPASEAPATRKAAEREAEPTGTLEMGRRVTAARDAHPRDGAASGLVTAQEDRAEVRAADPPSGAPHHRSWRVTGLALVVAVGLLTAVLVAVLTSGSSVPPRPPAPIAWQTPRGLELPMPLEGPGVAVWNDEVWVAGGCSLPHGPCGPPWVASVWHYRPAVSCHGSAWCPGPRLPFGLGHPALVSFEHHLYLIGGTGNDGKAVDTVYHLDSPTGHWQSAPRLPFPRAEGAAASDGSRIVFAGGVDRNNQPQADIWVFDGTQWNNLDQLHPTRKRLEHPRNLLAATSDGVGTVWFIGGEFGTTLSRAVDVVRGNDVTHAQLREPVTRSAAVTVGSRPPRYCAIGGGDSPSDKVQCQQGQGTSLPALKQPTSGPGAAILGNKVYVVGGWTNSLNGGIRTVEVLDISHVR